MTTMNRRTILLVSMLVLWMGIALAPPAFAQVTDCTGRADRTPCSDVDPCTYGELCFGGQCVGGWPITCSSDTCATRACNGTSTCAVLSAVPDGTLCDDGNACTAGDVCHAGGCAGMLASNGLRVTRAAPGSATSLITWSLPAGATGSDMVRGLVSGLPVSPTGVSETPLAQNQTGPTSLQDSGVPPPGDAYWYLVRGRNACGPGPWGFEEDRGRAALPEVSGGGCVPNAAASPRYVDNGPTVTDRTTCLEWEKKSVDPGANDVDSMYTWSSSGAGPNGTAFTVFLPTLNAGRFARHKNWRLPSEGGCNVSSNSCGCAAPHELESILLCPCCDGTDTIFGPFAPNDYWSSSADSGYPLYAWYVHFGGGGVGSTFRFVEEYVRAVRGGP